MFAPVFVRISKVSPLVRRCLSGLRARYRREEIETVLKVPSPRNPVADIAMEDVDLLFKAVLVRLREAVGDSADVAGGATGSTVDQRPDRLRALGSDCIPALEQLRTTMAHELHHEGQPKAGIVGSRMSPRTRISEASTRPAMARLCATPPMIAL